MKPTILFPQKFDLREPDSPLGTRPKSVESAVAWGTRFETCWAGQEFWRLNRDAYAAMRRHHPDMTMYGYYVSCSTRAPGESGKANYGFLDWSTVMVDHPEWFLRRDAALPPAAMNTILYELGDEHQRVFVDVANPECQDFIVSEAIDWVEGRTHKPPLTDPGMAFDGAAIDNAVFGDRMVRLADRAGHENWQYAGRVEVWNRGMYELLKKLQAALASLGKHVVANHNLNLDYDVDSRGSPLWDHVIQSVRGGGLMSERPLGPQGACYHGDAWLRAMAWHEKLTGEHKLIDWWVCNPANHEEFLYVYCSWLLAYVPGKSLWYAGWAKDDKNHPDTSPWYPEYDLCLGKPMGARTQRGVCFGRLFRGAAVIVNPTKWLTHDRVAGPMPPMSGRIIQ